MWIKEKLNKVWNKIADKLELFWNNHKEEIVEHVEKKLGFIKPISAYSTLDEIYYILRKMMYFHEHHRVYEDKNIKIDENHGGYQLDTKAYCFEIALLDVKAYREHEAYKIRFQDKDNNDILSFDGIIQNNRVVELEIFNKEYNAEKIMKTFNKILNELAPYLEQVKQEIKKETEEKQYNLKQKQLLEQY